MVSTIPTTRKNKEIILCIHAKLFTRISDILHGSWQSSIQNYEWVEKFRKLS